MSNESKTIHIVRESAVIHVLTNATTPGSSGGESTQWEVVTSNTSLVSGAYAVDALTLILLMLPAVAVLGQSISVYGLGLGGWRIMQRTGQQIRVGDKKTTLGAAGNIYSTSQGDYVKLTYLGVSGWVCTEIVGNLQVN